MSKCSNILNESNDLTTPKLDLSMLTGSSIKDLLSNKSKIIDIRGVQYRLSSDTHNSVRLFQSADGLFYIKYELRVHSKENMDAFADSGLPRTIKVYLDIPSVGILKVETEE